MTFLAGYSATIDFWDNRDETDNAAVLGHEGAGVVERVGKSVKSVKHGDTIKPVLRISEV
jgi:Zn-dependent alcohol dehydrogenase